MQPGARPLLAAKLVVPPARAESVVRHRLHELLSAADQIRLTTVVAPAGWGKTTLLSSWADAAAGSRVGWVSLDEADDEPVRFWTYAMSALAAVAPEPTHDALAALTGQGLDAVGVAVETLLNAFAATAADNPFVLVLDDYHVLSDQRIHGQVELLLAYLPPALRLVIASRVDPPLPLARLRARGQLAEIRAGDLRCTPAEATALLGTSPAVRPDVADQLAERTEGWAAGLHLAGLALRGADDPDAVAVSIGGGERHILDYFADEVLSGLDAPARTLLVRCSVLERVSGSLCDAVLGETGSAAVLDRLERADLFVVALDRERQWFRCHRLFRDVLRRELDATSPDGAGVLLGRAAEWFLAAGQVEEAVAHRLAAGDRTGALDLLRTRGRWFLEHGAMAGLLRLGEQSASGSDLDGRFCLSLAFAAGLSGLPDRAEHWLAAAEPLVDDASAPLTGWRSLRGAVDATWAAFGSDGDSQGARQRARRAVELEDDPRLWGWVVARQALAGTLLEAGDVGPAVDLLEETWRAAVRRELPTLLNLQAAGQLAFGLVDLGELARARVVIAEVDSSATTTERAWAAGAGAAVALLRLAEARADSIERGHPAAMPRLRRALELAEAWGRPPVLVEALTSMAEAQWAVGERGAGRSCLDRARAVASSGAAGQLATGRLTAVEGGSGARPVIRPIAAACSSSS